MYPNVGGIDFGFNNPFAAVWGHLDHDDVLWITGCRYVRQVTLPIHSEAIPKGVRYWCDPSGAEPIAQLRSAGHDVRPCVHRIVRGAAGIPRSPVLSGIDMVSERMRTGRLKIIRKDCLPLIRELSGYHYDEVKITEEPVKEDDHACDALRYLVVGLDRRDYVPSITDYEVIEREVKEREEAWKTEEQKRKEDEDTRARGDIDDERWWT